MIHSTQGDIEHRMKWFNDPDDADSLVVFDDQSAGQSSWEGLVAKRKFSFAKLAQSAELLAGEGRSPTHDQLHPSAVPGSVFTNVEAQLTQDHAHISVRTRGAQGNVTTLIIRLQDLNETPESGSPDLLIQTPSELPIVSIPLAFRKLMEVPPGILRGGRFVFLDQNFWVCTRKIGSEVGPGSPWSLTSPS